jgi:hypothetical protein
MRARLRSLAWPALVGTLAAALLSGCGDSASRGNGVASKSPAQIVAAAEAAAAGAATVHVDGSIVGEQEPISLNMELVAHKGGKGRLAPGGLQIELIDVDGFVYVKGSSAFYRRFAGPTAVRALEGKWLKAPAEKGPLRSLASLANLGKLIDGTLVSHGSLSSAGATTTVDGQKVVGVSDLDRGGTLYVAATGTPYPVQIVERGKRAGAITFDRWNRAVTLEVPTNVIDVNRLRGGS